MPSNTIKEIDASELAKWVNDATHDLRVIDVRQMQEIAMGTVPRAEPLPLHTLPAKVHELSREEKMVMVCRSGARSAQACMFLQQQGFSNVYNLRGGMMGWVQSGFPAAQLA
ncbi:MAG: sulfurtransferase [Gallionellales bacterium RIFCSPLOWO2_02_FULL_57_47]|nr:MAG: sulfurtransferase [Gallionellales bacterium RIFCSPLOWO2_02_FULL_57_47]OGT18274.1 MAG: sulfurtransferase [Gallionellales bacterium RIFCSPHIGHO2_02_FULL_57_16]